MTTVDCPRCGKSCEFSSQNPYRPFCSNRCQLIDLGQWADGKYTIPSEDPSAANEIENASTDEDPPVDDL